VTSAAETTIGLTTESMLGFTTKFFIVVLAAVTVIVEAVAEKVNVGLFAPSPRPRIVRPATSTLHAAAEAIVSA
jgi:hypothetical protein